MATLSQLIPYLESGHTLQSAIRETLTPMKSGRIEWQRPATRRKEATFEWCSLATVQVMHFSWEWGVVFVDAAKDNYVISDLAAIEEAINQNTTRYLFGELPQ